LRKPYNILFIGLTGVCFVKKNHDGFTVMETMMVIIILCLLAACYIPKYLISDRDKRIHAVKSLAERIQMGSNIVHDAAIAKGSKNNINFSNKNIMLGPNKYPTSDVNGIHKLLDNISDFKFSAGTYTKIDAPTEARCSIAYEPLSSPPIIKVDYSGC
jgi:prepilin-type N-terminal cleavage/methylation domain-containing protein